MKTFFREIATRLGFLPPPKVYIPQIATHYGTRSIADADAGNAEIKALILKGSPFMAGKLGSVELSLLASHDTSKPKKQILYNLENNAGFFPINKENCLKLAEIYQKILPQIDILAVWFNEKEDEIADLYAGQARLVRLRSLEPYYHQAPWSEALAGKVVLVIHPFADSIQKQYHQNHTRLFADERTLPAFTLKTLKAVQSIADNKKNVPFKNWFEALDYMQTEIQKIDFDTAIIGAGAYSLPLAGFIKSIGKQAIHMGGATQILFGIFGNRWEKNEIIKAFQNLCWIRPAPHETPKGAEKVENACYW